MRRLFLISCVSKKGPAAAPAFELYQSPLFIKAYTFASSQPNDGIYILSARHGLIRSDEVVEPYDETLNRKPVAAIKSWADKVIDQLQIVADLKRDKFTLLAGLRYRKFLVSHISMYEIPLEGLSIGKQLQRLDQLIHEHRREL